MVLFLFCGQGGNAPKVISLTKQVEAPIMIRRPNVENIVTQNNFKLRVLAYRKLTQAELLQAAAIYLKAKKRSTFPMNGCDTIETLIGFDER